MTKAEIYKNMTTLHILKKARHLISDPSRWTKGNYARNKNGDVVLANAPSATCFCALGAIRRVTGFDTDQNVGAVALGEVCPHRVHVYNDHCSHEQILALFDKAIEKEEAKNA